MDDLGLGLMCPQGVSGNPTLAPAQEPTLEPTGISGGGASASVTRTASGLLTVGGTTTNAWSTGDVAAGDGSVSVVSSELRWAIPNSGTHWLALEWTASPDRTKRWVQTEWQSNNDQAVAWFGLGVGEGVSAANNGYMGRSSVDRSTEQSGGIMQISAANPSGGSLSTVSAKSFLTTYVGTVKVDDDGASGLDVTWYDHDSGATAGPAGGTLLGTTAKVAWFGADSNGDVHLLRSWDMSDWVITVTGLASGEIARVVNSVSATMAQVVGGGTGTDTIDLHAASAGPGGPALIQNLVTLLIRNAADDTTLASLAPTDDGTHGEPGFFGGDAVTYTP